MRAPAAAVLLCLVLPVTAAAQVEPPAPPAVTPTPTATPAPKLPDGLTLRSANRRAFLAGHIDRRTYVRHRDVAVRARRAVSKLRGVRRAELASVLGALDSLAAEGRLAPSRLEQGMLTLRRNIEVFANGRVPRASERMTFGRDPLVFQYFPGRGVQIHPLGTFGAANALAKPCLRDRRRRDRVRVKRAVARGAARRLGLPPGARLRVETPRRGPRCRAAALRRTLDRAAAIAVRRGGFRAWEYAFPFGTGGAYWISSMSQATAVQALARGGEALSEPRYLELADAGLGAFEAPPPTGVRMSGGRYAMYSQNPTLEVFNGFLQALIGVHEHARLTGSPRSRRLFERAEPVARAMIGEVDTGAWSLYARGGREATWGYHQLARRFLGRLCHRVRHRAYCDAHRRFARYEREDPRVRPAPLRGLRAESPATIAFSLSKVSNVRIVASDRRGVSLRRVLTLPRGMHRVSWTPRRRGRQRLRIVAVGPGGTRTQVVRTFTAATSYREIESRRRAREAARRAADRAQRAAERRQARALRRARHWASDLTP